MRPPVAEVAPFFGLPGSEIALQPAVVYFARYAVPAKLGEMGFGQIAAVLYVLVIHIDDVDELAAWQAATCATMRAPQQLLHDVGQLVRSATQQTHRVRVPR